MKAILATVGNCIHVQGIKNFESLLKKNNIDTEFIGVCIDIEKLIKIILEKKPEIVGLSYRLEPENSKILFEKLNKSIKENNIESRFFFGGTPAVCEVAKKSGIFEAVFRGIETEKDILDKVLEREENNKAIEYSQNLYDRISKSYPFPLIRHHFGLPSLEKTIEGVREIAKSKTVDIISIGPDQIAQECFFNQENVCKEFEGGGGVPLRKKEDLMNIYESSRIGNFPLLRCYAGTNDLLQWGSMLKETINNAWGAIPLFWYSELDGRSKRGLNIAISENQKTIKWHAENNVPVEINDSHQWALRKTTDPIEVASAYIAAYNARNLGVGYYIQQFMMNVPPEISPEMDIAKMLAKLELISELSNDSFKILRMIRTGLASLSVDEDIAKGELASSITIGMYLKPHIVHVVGYSEAYNVATPNVIIESSKISRGVIKNCLKGLPGIEDNKRIIKRKEEILKDTKLILDTIKSLTGNNDPLTDAYTLYKAVEIGIMDAEDLKGFIPAKGEIKTTIIDGSVHCIDEESGDIISEKERINRLTSNSY
ncbi:MAG: B12 binding domain protein [Candidatus Methanofastidiosum methylothiophilum]|uniref:B12 binding domain protein n=1 Tax=Candidatus Methanofastidiosum methylothiophilum TaxID=1705564 RepID=A0A150ILN3_9EURY|nr:MAG: B12 binding domain protein [Candidatus Methanofastidiosum methylthiophilus]KYC48348.1 MAG: B12 binding domain protein [Candidatus Methanofastidiosum methylthiophilus]KYC50787.1 MAG: B12 binding domain protein [Candidatus Methanofastidiosum methylthiophilus]